MAAELFQDTSKGITELAKEVTASESVWGTFQKDPNGYAKKHGYAVVMDATAVSKIKSTSYEDAKAQLASTDLMSTAGLW
jgi:hypothetical protein